MISISEEEYELLKNIARNVYCYDREYTTEHDDCLADEFFADAEIWFKKFYEQ